MPNTEVVKVSTTGKSQFKALQREMPEIEQNMICAIETTICFKSWMSLSLIGIVQLLTLIDIINFYFVDTLTPFLLYLKDVDTLGIYLNNITNQLICQDGISISIFCKWGHAWFFVNKNNKIAMSIYLTDAELCWVHTCFGYLSINKLHKLLIWACQDIEHKIIEMINKFYHYCQIKSKAPQCFKFTLKKNVNFNYEIIVNIIYLDEKPIFHTIDAITTFQTDRFLNNMSAKETWDILHQCWIDFYLGFSDIITYNVSINFDFAEFRAETKILGIICHQLLIEAH